MNGDEAYKPIRSLERGLRVLAAIGEEGTNVAQLAAKTGLNRTTVYRILATLENNAFLTRSQIDHRYRLTEKVRTLSDGFTSTLWLAETVRPVLLSLSKTVPWPCNLAIFDGVGMVVLESTHRFSPVMGFRNTLGLTLPLASSLGHAFVAFSDDGLKNGLMPIFVDQCVQHGLASDASGARERLDAVCRQGYSVVIGIREPGIGGISMPIRIDGRPAAVINVVMSDYMFESDDLCEPMVEHLARAVEEIEQELARAATNVPDQ